MDGGVEYVDAVSDPSISARSFTRTTTQKLRSSNVISEITSITRQVNYSLRSHNNSAQLKAFTISLLAINFALTAATSERIIFR